MLGLSERIVQNLTEITNAESTQLPQWIDKKFVASCIVPPLSGNKDIHCNIAVVAPVSAGKSTLFNALCGYPILPVASKTTSAAPTYINRVQEKTQESVTVYAIKKEISQKDVISSTRYVRDLASKKTYLAKNISKEMFNDLFDYMYLINHGVCINDNAFEHKLTIENVAYFMSDVEMSDILFGGTDSQKWVVSKDNFTLSYDNTRHRLMLLLILLCVYVDQNDSFEEMGEYTKMLNKQRTDLLKKYGFPAGQDYCVCLDWCSDDIPENVTLIDLPGTGASTHDSDARSSHTALVRGILTEVDAIWVLCSDNGIVDNDLLYALNDVIVGNVRKSKVCIYNCKNGKPNDSGPVIDFLNKLPCLTGERCYVVDALAGEYKYIQNGINALMTKNAFGRRYDGFEEQTEAQINKMLEIMYNGERRKYCTFTTSKDALENIIAVQDSSLRYTLNTFFKCALVEYIERLKYEVAMAEAIKQAKFYVYIRESLVSSRNILEGIDGKGEDISTAVNAALEEAKKQAMNKYIEEMARHQQDMATDLTSLGDDIGEKIKARFLSSLNVLIENVKAEWRTLETKDHPNCLKANFFGNYPLYVDDPNWIIFKRVRQSAESKITISAFDGALKVADEEMDKYKILLNNYINNLKIITYDFVDDYVNAFATTFNKKRDDLCDNSGSEVTYNIIQKFDSTREKLEKAIIGKLNAMCAVICDSFDVLTGDNGIFDNLCSETKQIFRSRFCENILDKFRMYMYDTFTNTNYIGWFCDRMKPTDLHRILNNDFSCKKTEYAEVLSRIIDSMYGIQPDDGLNSDGIDEKNFPNDLSEKVTTFNGDKVVNGAETEIEKMHNNISSLVGFGASMVVDLSVQIKQLDDAIETWASIGKQYQDIYMILEKNETENTKKLYMDFAEQIENIMSESMK